MTPIDAAGVAVLGNKERRLMAAVLRGATGRATAEDLEALPSRTPGESLLAWACRSRTTGYDADLSTAECRRVQSTAESQLARARSTGVESIHLLDSRYPPLLATIPDPP